MKTFSDILNNSDIGKINSLLENKDVDKATRALQKEKPGFEDFLILLSPGAEKIMDQMAYKAQQLTFRHFGKNINLYIPLYISNECTNKCVYCGFNETNEIVRRTLSLEEIEDEIKYLKSLGFQNLLLLTGESVNKVNAEYIEEVVRLAVKYFPFIGLEIFPLKEEEYKKMSDAGARGLTIYQETYDRETYGLVHLKGRKKDYEWRLTTPDRALRAGFRKLNLGVLLGLFDWRVEAACLGLHAEYLMSRYWKSEISISFPRLKNSFSKYHSFYKVDDKAFVQMILSLRLFLPFAGITLSTRESEKMRDNLIGYGVTMLSAGSRTNPGGYQNFKTTEQFEISDERPLKEIIKVIRQKGLYPVFKDWDSNFSGVINESCN